MRKDEMLQLKPGQPCVITKNGNGNGYFRPGDLATFHSPASYSGAKGYFIGKHNNTLFTVFAEAVDTIKAHIPETGETVTIIEEVYVKNPLVGMDMAYYVQRADREIPEHPINFQELTIINFNPST